MSSSYATGGGDSGNTSAIVEDTVTGWHVLRIGCYSATLGLGVGKCIRSNTFDVGGHSWYIAYYPDGYNNECTNCISMFLNLDQPASEDDHAVIRARFKFNLLNQEGPSAYCKAYGPVWNFGTDSKSYGYTQFIKRNRRWELPEYLKDDCFIVRCDITVIVGFRSEAIRQFVPVPPSDLHKDFAVLLLSVGEGEEGTDVEFEVGRETFRAHRAVLAARSPVFKAALFGPMKEKAAAPVVIGDMEASVFKALLHFMYTDSLPDIDDGDEILTAQHLLVAADRYALSRLKLICEDTLCNRIDKSMVATTLVLAEQHGCHGLMEACFGFLASPGCMKAVMTTDGYDHLKRSCPSLVDELLAKLAP